MRCFGTRTPTMKEVLAEAPGGSFNVDSLERFLNKLHILRKYDFMVDISME